MTGVTKAMTGDKNLHETLESAIEKFSEEVRSGVDSLTKELAEMLAGVDRDLHHLKNRDQAETHEIEAVRDRMKNISLHFYSDHPRISELANDLVVLIKRLGV